MSSISETIKEYYQALDRLVKNKPIYMSKGYKINPDTVALEAGRKRGAIRADREVFNDLLVDIKAAAEKLEAPKKEQQKKLDKVKTECYNYKKLYQEAINREVIYLETINELEKKLSKNRFLSNNVHYAVNKK